MAHKVPPDGPQCEAPPVGAPYLNRLGTTLFQSGPESTGYPKKAAPTGAAGLGQPSRDAGWAYRRLDSINPPVLIT